MGNAKFRLMEKIVNLEQIEGKYSAFAKVPYALAVGMNKPLAEDGYGVVRVNGIEISKGKTFTMEVFGTMHAMLVPVGEVAREYGKEYRISFSGFKAEDGSLFRRQEFTFKTLPRPDKQEQYKEHDEVAIQAAREGIVLLQNNNNVLPLKADAILNCFGSAQYMFRNSSTGASLINPRWQADFHQSVAEHSTFSVNDEISKLYSRLQETVPTKEVLLQVKQKSDIALLFISRTSGEFLDNKPIKGGYYLTDEERQMIQAVSQVFDKTIAIVNTGYPIEMGWIKEYGISSVIYTGFAGMGAGYALVEILDGRTNPSGKLPDTFSYDYYDNPSSKNFINFSETDAVPGEKEKGVHIYYEEDIYVGYRYFDTFGKEVAYCFGHGESYTDFSIKTISVEETEENIQIEVSVTNTGNVAGKEVVQVYVKAPDVKLEKPSHVLCGFEKTKVLAPKEEQHLCIKAEKKYFTSFDEDRASYVLEAGGYELYVGNSLQNAKQCAAISLQEEKIIKEVSHINVPVEEFHRMSKEQPFVKENSKLVDLSERFKVAAKRPSYYPEALKRKVSRKISFSELLSDENLLDDFVAQMSDKELCKLNVSAGANWYMPWQDGSAGSTYKLSKYKLPSIKVSDGNAGLNIKKRNIGMPSSTVMAATFNKELAYAVGKVIGEESKENGIALNLGPGMNIHRNILNGRHPEYFSEDPYLAGTMAGMHGKGLVDAGTGCTYKHLFCNNSDTSRKGSHSIVSERAMREIYYRVFDVAMAIQKPTALMTSYNAVNGIYPAENAQVIQDLIRKEWNYDGFIMTDWCTYDTVDAVEMVKAGNCWLTEGNPKYITMLYKGLKEGRIERAHLEQNVRYLVKMLLHM